jgi:predicted Fe-Mo cluster-binding NifX family protein
MENYLVVLFKNKKKKRIIKKFITLNKAKSFFEKKIKESSEVIFEVEVENGQMCNYEIGLVELSSKQLVPVYITDEMGRNIKVKLEENGMTLFQITPYKKEEYIYDLQKKKKINTQDLIRGYLRGDGIKMVSSLNNKIVIQKDVDLWLFSLKNENESKRFIDCLSSHFFKIKRGDCILVKDSSSAQKKYLFSLLEEKGIDKKILYRKFTTYPPSK